MLLRSESASFSSGGNLIFRPRTTHPIAAEYW